jgi:hydrogenase nickel incorporation protein HypB
MCDTCGCNVTPGNRHLVTGDGKLAKTASGHEAVTVLQGLLSENDHQASHNREHFDSHGVLAINLMSSPGAGKTALLEATIEALGERFSIGVIEGDRERCGTDPRQGRPGSTDCDRQCLPPGCPHGP